MDKVTRALAKWILELTVWESCDEFVNVEVDEYGEVWQDKQSVGHIKLKDNVFLFQPVQTLEYINIQFTLEDLKEA